MARRDLVSMLEFEASRRPDIAAVVQRLHLMTDAEVDAVKVPLPWFHKAMHMMRQRRLMSDAHKNFDPSRIVDGHTPDPLGEMFEWRGETTFINIDRGGQIEIAYRRLIWFPLSGGVWITSIFAQKIDPRLLANSVLMGRVCRSQYLRAVRDAAIRDAPVNAPVIEIGEQSKYPKLAGLGVRFF